MKFNYCRKAIRSKKRAFSALSPWFAAIALFAAVAATSQSAPVGLPAGLAQLQLDAYNAKDTERFLSAYGDSVEVYNFPNQLQYKGMEAMRQRYAGFFAREPNVHCAVTARIVHGKTVIDHETLTGFADGRTRYAVAIYVVERNKIQKVYFVRE